MSVFVNLIGGILLLLAATSEAPGPGSTPFDSIPITSDIRANGDAFIGISDQDMVFNDQSALANKANLHSEQYSAFIQQLYRYDSENLQKFDHLYGQHHQTV